MENNSSMDGMITISDLINDRDELGKMCKLLFKKIFELTSSERK